MASNVIIVGGIGRSKATGIYRERNGRPTLTIQNLPLGSYTVYLFSLQNGRRTVTDEFQFDGRYLNADRPVSDAASLVAIAEQNKILAYGAADGVLPSAGELEGLLELHRHIEEQKRVPTDLLRGEPRFFREEEATEVVPKQKNIQPNGAYTGVSPEDFLLQTVTDPLMKEDLTALETERLISPSVDGQTENPFDSRHTPDKEASRQILPSSGKEYMQERSESTLVGSRNTAGTARNRTVILQENQPILRNEEEPVYYETIRREVEQLIRDYEHEHFLESFIEDSSFVRIPFDKAGHYYVFGVVSENGKPKYLCFAVPEPYRETPPDTLQGFTRFVPRDPLRPYGDGYFMMFQSAISGQTIPVRD